MGRTRERPRPCTAWRPRIGFLNGGSALSPRPTLGHVRRPAILAAAAEVISERGVIGTRIADVAERAGTSPPGVLYWFASKDELLAEALIYSDERFYEELAEALEQAPTARGRLRLLIERWPADGDGEAVLWMELWVRALHDPELAATRERLDRRWREFLADVIRGGQASGEFGAADADELAVVLGALMDGFAIQVALRDPTAAIERVRERCLALAGAQLGCELRGRESSWSGNEN
jgi:AcrR family transcriptional regulator